MNTLQGKVMIDPNDVVMLLIDHQSGLFNLVKDMPVAQLRNNVIALAKVAAMLKIPVITTASVPEGPNGPVIPEIRQFAPHAKYVACLAQAGVIPVDTFAVIGELQQTWNRPDALDYANLFGENILPNYRLLMESHKKAQEGERPS
ncbi:MAG: hypothetical protein PHI60_08260 [Candidatus Omnitrophica bacterium]|nr:hypothetical protein [Candidatus Omnitrophota bacterium]